MLVLTCIFYLLTTNIQGVLINWFGRLRDVGYFPTGRQAGIAYIMMKENLLLKSKALQQKSSPAVDADVVQDIFRDVVTFTRKKMTEFAESLDEPVPESSAVLGVSFLKKYGYWVSAYISFCRLPFSPYCPAFSNESECWLLLEQQASFQYGDKKQRDSIYVDFAVGGLQTKSMGVLAKRIGHAIFDPIWNSPVFHNKKSKNERDLVVKRVRLAVKDLLTMVEEQLPVIAGKKVKHLPKDVTFSKLPNAIHPFVSVNHS